MRYLLSLAKPALKPLRACRLLWIRFTTLCVLRMPELYNANQQTVVSPESLAMLACSSSTPTLDKMLTAGPQIDELK